MSGALYAIARDLVREMRDRDGLFSLSSGGCCCEDECCDGSSATDIEINEPAMIAFLERAIKEAAQKLASTSAGGDARD